jgi:hypothetical protein
VHPHYKHGRLEGISFYITEKMLDEKSFSKEDREKYRLKIQDYICNCVYQDYKKLKDKSGVFIQSELNTNIKSYIFHL